MKKSDTYVYGIALVVIMYCLWISSYSLFQTMAMDTASTRIEQFLFLWTILGAGFAISTFAFQIPEKISACDRDRCHLGAALSFLGSVLTLACMGFPFLSGDLFLLSKVARPFAVLAPLVMMAGIAIVIVEMTLLAFRLLLSMVKK